MNPDPDPVPRRRRWLKWLLVGAGVLVGLLAALWIAAEVYLIPRAMEVAKTELSRAGIHIEFEDADIRPLRGSLVVQNLTLYRDYERGSKVAFLSNVGVEVDVGALVRGRPLWGEGEVRDATGVIYGQDEDIEFVDLDAEIEVEAHEMRITRAGAAALGYDLALTGLIRWDHPPGHPGDPPAPAAEVAGGPAEEPAPPAPGPAAPEPEPSDAPDEGPEFPDFPGGFDWFESLAEIFVCEPHGDDRPDLTLDLTWDMTLPDREREDGSGIPFSQLGIEGTVRGEDLTWLRLPLDEIDAVFTLANWEVHIPRAKFVGLGGELTSSGVYEISPMLLRMINPVSTMQPVELCERLGLPFADELDRIEFPAPPTLRGDGLVIDFDSPTNTQVALVLESPTGVHYRADDAVLAAGHITCGIAVDRPGEFRLEKIDSNAGGLDIAGNLTMRWDSGARGPTGEPPPADATGTPAEPGAGEDAPPRSVAAMLKTWFDFTAGAPGPPKLSVDAELISGGPIKVGGRFEGEGFVWKGREIDGLELAFAIEEGVLSCDDIKFTGLSGTLEGSGSFDLARRIVRVPSLESDLNIAYLIEQLGFDLPPLMASTTFPSPPNIIASDLTLSVDDLSDSSGSISFSADDGFSISDGKATLTTDHFEVELAWPEQDLLIVDRISTSIGDLEIDAGGTFRWEPGRPTSPPPPPATEQGATGADADATGKPEEYVPDHPVRFKPDEDGEEPSALAIIRDLLTVKGEGEPVRLRGIFEWDGARRRAEIAAGIPGGIAGLSAQGSVDGRQATWRELPVRRGASSFTLSAGEINFPDLLLVTDTGELRSDARLDLAGEKLEISNVDLTLDPVQTIAQLGLEVVKENRWHARFPQSPSIVGRRLLVDFSDPRNNVGDLELVFPGGVVVVSDRGRELHLKSMRGALLIRDGVYSAKGLRADVLGGDARVDFSMAPFEEEPWYTIDLAVNRVSIEGLKEWAEPGTEIFDQGTFDFEFKGRGRNTLLSLIGRGRAKIDADEPVAHNFPIIDGLIGFLESLVPVLRRSRAWTLDLPFGIDFGKIRTQDADLVGPSVTATISGFVDLHHDKVDIDVGVNLRGIVGWTAGAVTSLFGSNLVNIKGLGPVDDVEWGLRGQVGRAEARRNPPRLPRSLRR